MAGSRAAPAWVAPAATAALGVAACSALLVHDPRVPGSYGVCPWLALTGTYCPGCGALRAVRSLIDGDLAAALAFNGLAVAAVPVLVYAWFAWTLWRTGRGRLPVLGQLSGRWVSGYAVLVVVYWVARNLPWAPFTALAPG